MEDVSAKNARYWEESALDTEFSVPFDLALFAGLVDRNARILDVGCGYGRTLAELHAAGFTNLQGVDFSKGLVGKGKRLHPQLNLSWHPGPDLPFPDASLDAVVLVAVLTCIPMDPDQEGLMAEIKRVLVPGGVLYASDFLLNTDERNLERYERGRRTFGCRGVFEIPKGAVLRHHTPERVRRLVRGFTESEYREQTFRTMRGHTSQGFIYAGLLRA